MRSSLKTLVTVGLFNLLGGCFTSFATASEPAPKAAIPDSDWEKVVVTISADDVKGLKRIGEVSATGKAAIASTDKLRKSATMQIQKQAAKMGATHIYIANPPSYGPFENPLLVGFAYAPQESAAPAVTAPEPAAKDPGAKSSTEAPITWEKVRTTRNPDDVKGLTRVGEVSATAKKLFGAQDKLRSKATVDLKKDAVKLGATIILIEVDNFAATPINNVNMIGGAYK